MPPTRASTRRAASPSARALLTERLRERLPEIERAATTRLRGISDAPERPDADYTEGLRSATRAALEYLLSGVERGDADSLHPPPAVLVQARLAARNRVGLDTVLRRCFAGHALFGDFLMGEMERSGDGDSELPKLLLREQAALLDRMIAAVSEEYRRETANRPAATEKRRARLVERLLAGEPLDDAELGYQLEASHLAVVAKGSGAAEMMRDLASTFGRRLFALSRDDEVLWTWLGGKEPLDPDEALRRAMSVCPPEMSLAFGEPSEGAEGWRLSHRQAAAALPVAVCGKESVVRYADVALLAAALRDELLATSLREMYLEPLERGRDGGEVLRETLKAYFAAGRNVSSTAAALRVNRSTVATRIGLIETTLKRPLPSYGVDLETALRLADLETQETELESTTIC
jgi:hypothetical protein